MAYNKPTPNEIQIQDPLTDSSAHKYWTSTLLPKYEYWLAQVRKIHGKSGPSVLSIKYRREAEAIRKAANYAKDGEMVYRKAQNTSRVPSYRDWYRETANKLARTYETRIRGAKYYEQLAGSYARQRR